MSANLFEAVNNGDVAALRAILASGAYAQACDAEGNSLLMLAAQRGDLPMVRALLDAGANVNAVDGAGWSALTRAVYNPTLKQGFPEVVQALIDAGAALETPIGYGVRPLMLAAGYGETAVVEVLLAAGADVLARNEGGYTALMMVTQKNYVDVINLLHEAEQLLLGDEAGCASKAQPSVITFMARPS
ncbi:MAG: ankyrin repeat domain-containing protein [Nitrosomonadales bacterium]|nr:ankyrin repeat domain-containing protein [Nitrosomonadales bacterium]